MLFDYSPEKSENNCLDVNRRSATGVYFGLINSLTEVTSTSNSLSRIVSLLLKPTHLLHIFKYGIMTMSQAIPGFFSFAFSRYFICDCDNRSFKCLYVCCGNAQNHDDSNFRRDTATCERDFDSQKSNVVTLR